MKCLFCGDIHDVVDMYKACRSCGAIDVLKFMDMEDGDTLVNWKSAKEGSTVDIPGLYRQMAVCCGMQLKSMEFGAVVNDVIQRHPALSEACDTLRQCQRAVKTNEDCIKALEESLEFYTTLIERYRETQWTINLDNHKIQSVQDSVQWNCCPCPVDSCKGRIWKSKDTDIVSCTICHARICWTCQEYMGETVEHVCDNLKVQSIQRLREASIPCPRCLIPIQKSEGCDQMFCVQCHYSFDFRTGCNIQRSQLENPHYDEYLNQQNGHDSEDEDGFPGDKAIRKQYITSLEKAQASMEEMMQRVYDTVPRCLERLVGGMCRDRLTETQKPDYESDMEWSDIEYALPEVFIYVHGKEKVEVYTALYRKIARIVIHTELYGSYEISWNFKDGYTDPMSMYIGKHRSDVPNEMLDICKTEVFEWNTSDIFLTIMKKIIDNAGNICATIQHEEIPLEFEVLDKIDWMVGTIPDDEYIESIFQEYSKRHTTIQRVEDILTWCDGVCKYSQACMDTIDQCTRSLEQREFGESVDVIDTFVHDHNICVTEHEKFARLFSTWRQPRRRRKRRSYADSGGDDMEWMNCLGFMYEYVHKVYSKKQSRGSCCICASQDHEDLMITCRGCRRVVCMACLEAWWKQDACSVMPLMPCCNISALRLNDAFILQGDKDTISYVFGSGPPGSDQDTVPNTPFWTLLTTYAKKAFLKKERSHTHIYQQFVENKRHFQELLDKANSDGRKIMDLGDSLDLLKEKQQEHEVSCHATIRDVVPASLNFAHYVLQHKHPLLHLFTGGVESLRPQDRVTIMFGAIVEKAFTMVSAWKDMPPGVERRLFLFRLNSLVAMTFEVIGVSQLHENDKNHWRSKCRRVMQYPGIHKETLSVP